MPLAAVRQKDTVFLISVSNVARFDETQLDYTRNEMRMNGYLKPPSVEHWPASSGSMIFYERERVGKNTPLLCLPA
jgi:hypothetical protein